MLLETTLVISSPSGIRGVSLSGVIDVGGDGMYSGGGMLSKSCSKGGGGATIPIILSKESASVAASEPMLDGFVGGLRAL